VIRLAVRGDLSGDPFQLSVLKNSTAVEIQGGAAVIGQWASIVGIQTSATSRELWVNGVQVATSVASVVPADFDSIRLGCAIGLAGATEDAFLDGDLADFGLWNVALTPQEIVSISKGYACEKIRPRSLVRDVTLVRTLQDLRLSTSVTAVNNPTVANHPPIYQ
jgi:Concanavalin A-like lectin/glucanases superfamily